MDQQWCKSLTHTHDPEQVDLKGLLDFIKVNVERGNGVVAAGVVDEEVESAAGSQT